MEGAHECNLIVFRRSFESQIEQQDKQKRPTYRWAFFVYMARPARFERATAWFVARYSIQLSYGRVLLSEAGLSRCC
jgi:hypothetical protein